MVIMFLFLFWLADGSLPPFNVGMNVVQPTLPSASAFLGEAMGTFLLVFTVLLTAVYPKSIAQNLAPIAIGWSVLLAHLLLIPLTGCGINPARSLGPMLVTIFAGGKAGYRGWWVYYTAPFVGYVIIFSFFYFYYHNLFIIKNKII